MIILKTYLDRCRSDQMLSVFTGNITYMGHSNDIVEQIREKHPEHLDWAVEKTDGTTGAGMLFIYIKEAPRSNGRQEFSQIPHWF